MTLSPAPPPPHEPPYRGTGGGGAGFVTSRSVAPTALGLIAMGIAIVGMVPAMYLGTLAATVDANYAWLIFLVLPIAGAAAALALILSTIGFIIADRQGRRSGWSIAGLVLGGSTFMLSGYLFLWG